MVALVPFILALSSPISVSALTLNGPSLILPGSVNANDTNRNYIVECSGTTYGFNLDSADCVEALSQIDDSSTVEQTYGQRYEGVFDVKLPKRYLSSNGHCAIEPRLLEGENSARASLQEVASAARRVINQCVSSLPNQGGKVDNIGGDNNLSIMLRKIDPQVECFGTVSPSLLPSCQNIVNTLPATLEIDFYGPASDPEVDVRVPVTYWSQDRRCKVTIRTDGPKDTCTRYAFWAAASLLTELCVKGGKMGKREGLGHHHDLSIEIGPA